MNVYLTLDCRRLRPDVQLLGRVALDRNLSTMHRAGADFVLSYPSTGATDAWNALRDDAELILIGDDEAEQHFLARYVVRDPRERLRGWLAGRRAPLDRVS